MYISDVLITRLVRYAPDCLVRPTTEATTFLSIGGLRLPKVLKNMIQQYFWRIIHEQVPSDSDQNHNMKEYKEYEGWHRAEAVRRGASA
jgi:hypothetical protein